MYIYHVLINALSTHMIDINLNMIFYTHVEHSSTKTIYVKYNMEKQINKHTHTHMHACMRTHTHTHTCTQTNKQTCLIEFKMVSVHSGESPSTLHHISQKCPQCCL